LDAVMLEDRMLRWLAYGVGSASFDFRHPISDAMVSIEKLPASHRDRDMLPIALPPIRRRYIREIASPSGVVDIDVTVPAVDDRTARDTGDDAITHEGSDTHGTIVSTTDFVANTGIDAPY